MNQNLADELRDAAHGMDRWTARVTRELMDVGHELEHIDGQGGDIWEASRQRSLRVRMAERVAAITPIASMSVIDKDGNWRISSRYEELPALALNPKRPIWNAASNAKPLATFILPPQDSPAIGVRSLVVGVVPRDKAGNMLCIIVGFVPMEIVESNFNNFRKNGRQVSVRSRDGQILYASTPIGGQLPWLGESRGYGGGYGDGYGGGTSIVNDHLGNRFAISTVTSTESGLTFAAAQSVDPLLKNVEKNIAITIFVGLAGLAVATAILVLWVRQREFSYSEMLAANEVRLEMLASLQRDSTTGLLNSEGLRYALESHAGASSAAALLVIGVNHLQRIVEPLSDVGRDLIKEFARRVRDCSRRDSDYCARTALDEFCVVQYFGKTQDLVEKLLLSLSEPYILGDRSVVLGASIGTVEVSGRSDWSNLHTEGRIAMNRARGFGHGKFCAYDCSLDRAAKERLAIERELPLAIGTDELFMVYQPIYSFDRDAIVGFEALMRWQSAKLGAVPPGKFIPVAESEGLLQPIEKMVARSPLAAASLWSTDIFISINASAIEFRDRSFAEKMRANLARAGIDPKRLIIEVTESAMIEDDEVALSVMRDVKALGVQFALDDFGSGYASLSYLHRFPFDRLKIDMSLVRELNSPSAVVIIEAALAIAYRLGIEVVAEGVEFYWQFERLRSLGCHYVQGYFIGKPMPEADVSPFLESFRSFS